MEENQFPKTVNEVFNDFSARRNALIKALTVDMDRFYRECDPAKENLCLYGLPDEKWVVSLPVEEVPPELPEPALGINFARDGMAEKDWVSLVAVHSDAWLLSVAFYFGARFGFGKNERKRLFGMINELPTIFDVVIGNGGVSGTGVVCGTAVKPVNEYIVQNNGSKNKVGGRMQSCQQDPQLKEIKASVAPKEEDDSGGEEEYDDEGSGGEVATCGSCGVLYQLGEFWIGCDVCEKWFHGKCVRITPAKAEHIKQYKCPTCSSNKRSRP